MTIGHHLMLHGNHSSWVSWQWPQGKKSRPDAPKKGQRESRRPGRGGRRVDQRSGDVDCQGETVGGVSNGLQERSPVCKKNKGHGHARRPAQIIAHRRRKSDEKESEKTEKGQPPGRNKPAMGEQLSAVEDSSTTTATERGRGRRKIGKGGDVRGKGEAGGRFLTHASPKVERLSRAKRKLLAAMALGGRIQRTKSATRTGAPLKEDLGSRIRNPTRHLDPTLSPIQKCVRGPGEWKRSVKRNRDVIHTRSRR